MTGNQDSPDRDGTDPEERLGRLCDELDAALAAGESIVVAAWAQRFSLPEADVRHACDALSAMRDALGDELAESARAPIAPPQLPADYELLGELGRGGMGVVYRARQRSLDRELAVKVLRPGEQWFADAVARFEREAKSLARLRHRHIVSVHEVGRADGFVYFTMDYIAGATLQRRLEDGPLTTSEAVRLLSQVASAIAYAHQKGVVHRDLKPANILLDGSGDAFVCDFGLARDLAAGGSGATLSGQLLGTPGYMSPEQALGDRARIGEASDVYALGAVLYECLTGAAPFAGLPLAQLMHAVIEREPLPAKKRNAAVPPDLEVICDKAMQKRPEDRYATVQALAEDLERFTIGREILARRRSGWSRTARLLRRNHRAVWSGAAAVLVLLVFGWWFVLPTVLRRQAIALAERLHDGGYAAGAVTAYREAFAGSDAAAAPVGERLGYARALVDEAGRLYLHGSDDEAPRAAAMADEAVRVLGDVPNVSTSRPLPESERRLELDLMFERLRVGALRGEQRYHGWLMRDWHPRQASHQHGAGADADGLLKIWLYDDPDDRGSRQMLEAMLDALPAIDRLPPPLAAQLRFLTQNSSELQTADAIDFDLMDRLITMAANRNLVPEARRGAAALFNAYDWLPFVREHRQVRTPHSQYNAPIITDDDLDWVVASYREVRDLPALEGFRRRVQLVAQRLMDMTPAWSGSREDRRGSRLRFWLQQHGLGWQAQDVAGWLREHGDKDPRLWQLRQLRWQIDPEAVRPVDVLDRLRSVNGVADPLVWLLELTAPPGTPVPHITVHDMHTALVRWEAALAERPDLRRCLRLATFVMIDGEPTPRLAWQHRAELGCDAPIRWQSEPLTEWPFSNAHVGRRIGTEWLARAGRPRVTGDARLQWNGHQLKLRCNNGIASGLLSVSHTSVIEGDHDVPEGMVGCFGGYGITDSAKATQLAWFTLATLQPLDGADEAWTAERWRAECGASIERLATTDYGFAINNLKHVVIATLFPMPERREQLRKLHDLIRTGEEMHRDYLFDMRRAALLLAGDTGALTLEPPEQRDRVQLSADEDFWLRLALTTGDATLRDAAFAQLKPEALDAGQLRTLAAARREGFAVPEAFAAKLPPAYGPRVLWWSANAFAICLATANVLAVLVLLRALRRRPLRRFAGAGLMLLGWGLTSWSLVIGTTEYNPIWIAHTVHIVGCAALCWGRPGALPLLTPLWWAGATIAQATDHLAHPLLVWSIAALLLLSELVHHAAPRVRAAEPAA